MAKSDWKAPFLQLRDQIRPLFDSGVKLYHGILMAPFHERKDLKEVVGNLESCSGGKKTVAVIETPTEGCMFHAHYFFGDSGGCSLLGHTLNGIDDWMRAIPKDLLPRFDVPCHSMSEQHRNLVTWASLVYYLAWEIDTPYLQSEVEHQASIEVVGFFPWSEWPQPEGCDPRPLLVHQQGTAGQFEKFLTRFADCEEFRWCPDIIDTYLLGEPMIGEFILASLAAVDILVFMLDQVRGKKAEDPNIPASSVKRKRQSRSRRISNDIILLQALLEERHNVELHGAKARTPLTAEQIAIELGWYSKSGKPLQARVSRRMAEHYKTPNGMEKYRSLFVRDTIRRGLFNRNPDGTTALDGYAEDEKD